MPRLQKSFTERFRRQVRYLYLKFVRLRGHPEELARGLAAGVFAGMFPLFGLQTIIGVAIAFRIKGNPLMAAAGTWVSNPLTYIPLFAFNYQVGCWILGRPGGNPFGDVESLRTWLETGTDAGIVLMLGSFVVGVIGSILAYCGGLPLIRLARKEYRHLRHLDANQ